MPACLAFPYSPVGNLGGSWTVQGLTDCEEGKMPAPRRNHYVPRFLLKRFSSRSQGKKSWIWQVSHEDDPVEISTRDAAVTRDFYGGPSSGVEDAFATAETRFADVLAAIESGDSPQLHQKELREFIWTLVVRTRAFRQQFAQFSGDLLEKVLESAAFAPGDDRLLNN